MHKQQTMPTNHRDYCPLHKEMLLRKNMSPEHNKWGQESFMLVSRTETSELISPLNSSRSAWLQYSPNERESYSRDEQFPGPEEVKKTAESVLLQTQDEFRHII